MTAGVDNRQKLACCHRMGAASPLGVWPTVKVAVASPEGATLWSLKVTALAFGRPMMGSGVSMKSICLCISVYHLQVIFLAKVRVHGPHPKCLYNTMLGPILLIGLTEAHAIQTIRPYSSAYTHHRMHEAIAGFSRPQHVNGKFNMHVLCGWTHQRSCWGESLIYRLLRPCLEGRADTGMQPSGLDLCCTSFLSKLARKEGLPSASHTRTEYITVCRWGDRPG